MASTKDQQVKKVVIGMALGVLAQGVKAVTSRKSTFELAFERAWPRWAKASQFPSINGRRFGNLFWLGVQRSERRRGICAAWECGRSATKPYLVYEDWTVADALEVHADETTTAADWIELGRLFVEYLKPDNVYR